MNIPGNHAHWRVASRVITLLLTMLFCLQCAKVGGTVSMGNASYALNRAATNIKTNTLNIHLDHPDGYTFSIEGTGFEADIAIGVKVPIQELVHLTYTEEGSYQLILKIFQSDGAIIMEDVLPWEYSTEVPPDPVVSFSEVATSDDKVLLLVDLNKGIHTNELSVVGDVGNYPSKWHKIEADGTVPLQVSAADGLKKMVVKYRNIYGTESRNSLNIQILKKSIGPKNCAVTVDNTTTATGQVRMQLSALNDGNLYYLPLGEVTSTGTFTRFSNQTTATVSLLGGPGVYKLTMQLRDIAENYCPTTSFTVTYDPTHTSEGISVENNALWTDNPVINVLPRIDHVGSDVVEMNISGDIVPSATTFQWISYQAITSVQLSPVDGNRFVRVQYRLNGTQSVVRSVAIFLTPYLRSTGASSPYQLELSNIVGLTSVSITGCTEVYDHIAYQSTVTCTSPTPPVTATYYLKDGTSVSRSVTP